MNEHPRDVLRRLERRARKRFGQHFLVRRDIVTRVLKGARVEAGDRVLEVGPGLGILTGGLLAAGAEVVAIEVDPDLAEHLRHRYPRVRLIEGDALQIDPREACPGSGWKLVANLPYNIGTTLVVDWVQYPGTFDTLTVMLQKEVVDRLVARPGDDAYGAVTAMVAARAEARFVALVPPEAFHPRPKVQSAIVRLELYPEPRVGPAGEAGFDRVVKAGFAQRRKTVANSVGSLYGKSRVLDALAAAGIEPRLRAERLDVDAFRRLAAELEPSGPDDG